MKIGNKKIPSLPCISVICTVGFLLGIVMLSLWQDNLFFQNEILNIDFINEMNHVYVDKRALFFLCMRKRLRAFFVLTIMSVSVWNLSIVLSFFAFQGFAVGAIMELLVIRYGGKGFIVYLASVFPHGILYLWGYFILGCWCLNAKTREADDKKKGVLLASFMIILGGIYLESMFSLKIFLMILDV